MNAQPQPAPRSPAEVYEEFFVPALFAPWGPRVAEAAAISPGEHVLDVGCGTGVLACAAAERVGVRGRVVGLDANDDMLAVARRKPQPVEWQHGLADALPFADASFDAVVSQFALMLFNEPQAAIGQMLRVLRPGGRLAVAVLDELDHAPGYRALTELLQRLFGAEVADAMRPPFALGDRRVLRPLFEDARAIEVEITTHPGTVRFVSIDAMIATERACIWTLGGLLDSKQFVLLRRHAAQELQQFAGAGGAVAFGCPAHIVTAKRA